MKTSFSTALIAATVLLSSCRNDVLQENSGQQNVIVSDIQVVDGHLKFISKQSLSNYIDIIKQQNESSENNRVIKSTSITHDIPNFTSLKDAIRSKKMIKSVSVSNEDELDFDPTLMLKSEQLLPDPVLEYVISPEFRIDVGDRKYKITEFGTFSVKDNNNINLDSIVSSFDTTNIQATLLYEDTYDIGNDVQFVDSYGLLSGEKSIVNNDCYLVEEFTPTSPLIKSMNPTSNTQTYGLNSYKWESKTWVGKALSWLFGKDAYRENYHDSKHRTQAELFQVNYGFYASTGFKVKFQVRKKFLFISYWVQEYADDIVVGIEELDGKMNFNAIPGDFFNKAYSTFTSTLQGHTNNIIYTGLGSPTFLSDWSKELLNIICGIMPNVDWDKWKIDPYKYTKSLDKDLIYGQLNSLTGKYIYNPIKKQVLPKDPRVAYLFYGQNKQEAKSFISGIVSYGRSQSKTIYFSQSAGFTVSWGSSAGVSAGGYIPVQYTIENVKIFGAVKWNGIWRGVRFTN